MEAFVFYLIRASVYLLVFSLGYYLLLSRQNTTVFNRFYILFSFAASLIMAGIHQIPLRMDLNAEGEGILLQLPAIVVGARSEFSGAGNWLENISLAWLYAIPLLFSGIFLIVLLFKLTNLYAYIQKYPREKLDEVELVLLPANHSPFSFFHWIFIPGNLKESEYFQKVITHERAHFVLKHSWDVILMETLRLLFWFHPAFYYLKAELQTLHEYDADNYALKKYSRTDYQQALLNFALGAQYLPVTNPFNVSTIKKRFIMMNKNQHPNLKGQLFRLLLILPFIAGVFFIQSCNLMPDAEEVTIPETEELTQAETAAEPDPIFTVVEVSPEFPGGQSELMKFLQDNLRYPENAREKGIQGTVFVSFVVEKDGSASEYKLLRGVENGTDLDEEALRVIKMMPDWSPGYQRGEAVRVQYNLPIRFALN